MADRLSAEEVERTTRELLENDDELRAASAELRDRMRSLSLESRPFSGAKDAPTKAVP